MKNSAPKNSKHNDGPRHWRSLEHKADSPEFREFVEKEFPSGVDLIDDPVSRRNFMKIMSASFALAGLGVLLAERRREPRPVVARDRAEGHERGGAIAE